MADTWGLEAAGAEGEYTPAPEVYLWRKQPTWQQPSGNTKHQTQCNHRVKRVPGKQLDHHTPLF
jgi:hypothetical protein